MTPCPACAKHGLGRGQYVCPSCKRLIPPSVRLVIERYAIGSHPRTTIHACAVKHVRELLAGKSVAPLTARERAQLREHGQTHYFERWVQQQFANDKGAIE